MKKQIYKVAYFLFLICLLNISFSQIQVGQDIDGEAAGDYAGSSVSMPDAYTIAIGAWGNDGNGSGAGHVRVYTWNGSFWLQKGQDIDGEATDDNSGGSVYMPDANTIAIGALGNSDDIWLANPPGHVRIYTWNGNTWQQKGQDIDGEAAGDYSGRSVSMPDSNTVAIGADGNFVNGPSTGHVRIYVWNGNTWQQKGQDIDGEAAGDYSGWSVSMPNPNTVAVGAYGSDGNTGGSDVGRVRIYD